MTTESHICSDFPQSYLHATVMIRRCLKCQKLFTGIVTGTNRSYRCFEGRAEFHEGITYIAFYNKGFRFKYAARMISNNFLSELKYVTYKGFIKLLTFSAAVGIRILQRKWRKKRKLRRSNHLSKIKLFQFDIYTNRALASKVIDYSYS